MAEPKVTVKVGGTPVIDEPAEMEDWSGEGTLVCGECETLRARVAEQATRIEELERAVSDAAHATADADFATCRARIADLERERDAMFGRDHEPCLRIAKLNAELTARAERAEQERDEALAVNDSVSVDAGRRIAKAEATAAAMREALTQVHPAFGGLGRIETDAAWVNEQINAGARAKRQEVLDAVSAALSPDAGRALLEERDGLREALASLKPVFHELSSAIGLLWARTPPEAKQQLTRAQAAMERFDAALARSKGTT